MRADIDHVVLWAADPLLSLAFYRDVVGFEPLRASEYEAGDVPFPSVRLSTVTIIDLMPKKLAPWLNEMGRKHGLSLDAAGFPTHHLCLALSRADFEALRERLRSIGDQPTFEMKESFGARGSAPESFYFADPDQNIIEARYYGASGG